MLSDIVNNKTRQGIKSFRDFGINLCSRRAQTSL